MLRDDRPTPLSAPADMAGGATPGFYRYPVGEVEVTAIHDGYFDLPLEGFIKNAPLDEVKATLAGTGMPEGHLRIPFTSLALKMGGKTVLIDTSYGEMGPPTAGQWMQNFKAAGFSPEQIDVVVLSHFHADHINGLRGKDGQTPFPNATIMVPKVEWDFWMDAERRRTAPEALKDTFENSERVFGPVRDVVKTFEDGAEVLPGLVAIAVPGHTPGHTAFMLTSGGAKLLLMSDTSNNPLLFAPKPQFQSFFDMDGSEAERTRRALFKRAADEKLQVSFFHAPFPATGHLVGEGEGFRFVPLG